MRVLIWGRLTPSSAFASGVILQSYARPIDSVWRFGRDLRHLMNGEKKAVSHEKCILMNLHRTRISPEPGIKKGTEVLHAGSNKFVCAQSICESVEVSHQGLI